jgi:predicted ATPase/DNA-binding CsgD family transcriptional regulator
MVGMGREGRLATRGSLPAQLTRFFGRVAAMGELVGLLDRERLVSLVGAPGCGKTRLVIETAARAESSFAGGVWFVELASISDPKALATTVASALGVREEPGRPVEDALGAALKAAPLSLLVLDNCEHLIAGVAALVRRLLADCPALRVLATSRVALGLPDEHVHQVGPLDPDAAAALFVDRASLASGAFSPEAEAEFVAPICAHLDHLPLAIELVAAWTRVLSSGQIAERLASALPWPAHGRRGRGSWHETMTATVDWSYRLLPPSAQSLFRRLSVFAGGFDLEAAEAVAGSLADGEDVLCDLVTLVDHSLVTVGGDRARRYRLLEPVRQCGEALLAASGDDEVVRRRHAEHYLAIAREFEIWDVLDAKASAQLQRVLQEEGNLLAAREWVRVRGHDLLLSVTQMSGALWERGSRVSEGRVWLDELLADETIDGALRVRVVMWSARLAWRQGRFDEARALLKESRLLMGSDATASTVVLQLLTEATIATSLRETAVAVELSKEAVAIAHRCDHPNMLAACLITLAWAYYTDGKGPAGDEQLRVALEDRRQAASKHMEAQAHFGLQYGAFLAGDPPRQRHHLAAALRAADEGGTLERYAWLGNAGMLAVTERRHPAALRLFGASTSSRWGGGQTTPRADDPGVALYLRARDEVGADRAMQLLVEGAALGWDDLVADALAEPSGATDGESPLTPRETEIAALVGQGMTNAEIADRLSISRRTVDSHLDHIRHKLNLGNRRQIVVWSLRDDP